MPFDRASSQDMFRLIRSNAMASLAVPLLSLGLFGSCIHLEEDDWSFPLTRAAYGDGGKEALGKKRSQPRDESSNGTPFDDVRVNGDSGAAIFVGALFGIILIMPVAVDLIILPVTLPHDIFTG